MKKLFGRNAYLFAATLLVAGVAVAALSFRGPPKRKLRWAVSQTERVLKPAELAAWIVEGRRDFAVIDLRDESEFTRRHVRGAVSCGTCHASKEEGRQANDETMFVDLSKKLVLYTDTGTEDVDLPKMLAKNPRLYLLEGGWAGWQREVLAPVTFGGEVTEEELHAKRKREALRAFFAGERPTSAPAQLPLAPIKRKGAHQPAGAREGC